MIDRIRILCVDDHPVLRDGVAFALQKCSDMELVGDASTGEEAVRLFKSLRPDIVLMDLRMPGMSGTEAILAIRKINSRAKIVVLTTYQGDVEAHKALLAGASGYLLKHMLRTDLIATIRAVHAGEKRVPSEVARSLVEQIGHELLSQREVEILGSVARGNSNKDIAVKLSISEDTVKAHLKHILVKLGANDRTHAVTLATKRGILPYTE